MKHCYKLRLYQSILGFCSLCSSSLFALTFPLPTKGDLIGELQTTTVQEGESLGEVGRRFDMGVYEMIEANPNLDPWAPPKGSIAIIPSQFILPKGPRTGIVLNLAEMRLYYYDKKAKTVITHPLGIGKKGWSTPLGETVIVDKKKHPPWIPPVSIHKEHLAKNDPLPAMVPGDTPENPLGNYAFYLRGKGLDKNGNFLIHGTNRPAGVGVRVTHGCIRLFPEDIETLFYQVPVGTTVRIIHEPYKVGWSSNDHLYLEAHQPLTEYQFIKANAIQKLTHVIESAIKNKHLVNWASAKFAAQSANGYPVKID